MSKSKKPISDSKMLTIGDVRQLLKDAKAGDVKARKRLSEIGSSFGGISNAGLDITKSLFPNIPNITIYGTPAGDIKYELAEIKSLILEQQESHATVPENKLMPRVPKQLKRQNDWKAAWRKIKGRWKDGASYQELAQLTIFSSETIADIVRAGESGLLD